MTEQINQDHNESAADFYAYIEPMGHGEPYVALVHPTTVINGTTQMDVIGANGQIAGTMGLGSGAIFRWRMMTKEAALLMATKLKSTVFHPYEFPQMVAAQIPAETRMPHEPGDEPEDFTRDPNGEDEPTDPDDEDRGLLSDDDPRVLFQS